ncbi:glucose 1-dehydrogenase [Microbacterium capsulatum]|uniref:SDR family oxidoreductase n=1 Tax=Microbacterium capsulatum TaxID=3041921 RepID=A0ABU0XEY6_9MICO|nr:glucose 1-dehydrogenase [Microbacterium sp. ASV81]MDQ4213672.1 SDR family oxidoreductase [Microbacterium sp. ASV81]
MARLDGKVVLISGAARGMGAAHARRFVSEGARVVLGDVLREDAAGLAAELGPAAIDVPLDVADYAAWEAAVAAARETFGRLDALVNNAGIAASAPVDEYPLEGWDRIIAVNLTGTFYGIRASVPALRASGGGSIVNISSVAGLKGMRNIAAYTASKFGVRGLTKTAALDLGPDAIRVNSVHPGLVRTPIIDGVDDSQTHVALKRVGEPEEVSDLVLFLVSDESRYCTGAEFVIDGGETAGIADYVGRRTPVAP